jgi:zinc transporter ZupT
MLQYIVSSVEVDNGIFLSIIVSFSGLVSLSKRDQQSSMASDEHFLVQFLLDTMSLLSWTSAHCPALLYWGSCYLFQSQTMSEHWMTAQRQTMLCDQVIRLVRQQYDLDLTAAGSQLKQHRSRTCCERIQVKEAKFFFLSSCHKFLAMEKINR